MKLIDDSRKKGFDEKIKESKMILRRMGEDEGGDPYSKLVPGPHTL